MAAASALRRKVIVRIRKAPGAHVYRSCGGVSNIQLLMYVGRYGTEVVTFGEQTSGGSFRVVPNSPHRLTLGCPLVLVGLAMSSQLGHVVPSRQVHQWCTFSNRQVHQWCTFLLLGLFSFAHVLCRVLFLVVICAFNGHGSRRNHRGFLVRYGTPDAEQLRHADPGRC